MRVLVCGQKWNDYEAVRITLERMSRAAAVDGQRLIIHGAHWGGAAYLARSVASWLNLSFWGPRRPLNDGREDLEDIDLVIAFANEPDGITTRILTAANYLDIPAYVLP